MEDITLHPIGVIRSPFTELEKMPIQPAGARDVRGTVILDEALTDGLQDLEGFSHIFLIYHFHRAQRIELQVVPFLDTRKRGVFATRSPLRPSHIGMSIVALCSVAGNRIEIGGVDVLDGTPLLDIKPYMPPFDRFEKATSGWMKASRATIENQRSDDRFL
jgi:tRNA-Thr(GGU) m(6)t(6)A37 methyltransferase TsaA